MLQGGDQAVQVVAPDVHIRIRDDQDIVAGSRHHVDEIADLAVRSVDRGINHQRDIVFGKLSLQLADNGDGRIGGILHAEDDLPVRVILPAECGQCFLQQRLVAVQRLQYRHGRLAGRGPLVCRRVGSRFSGLGSERGDEPGCHQCLGEADTGAACGQAGEDPSHEPVVVMSWSWS